MTEIKENIIDAEIKTGKESKEAYTTLDVVKAVGKCGCTIGTARIISSFCNTYGRRPGDSVLMDACIGITSWFMSDTVCEKVVETMDRKLDETAKAIADFKEAVARASEKAAD